MGWSDEDFLGNSVERVMGNLRRIIIAAEAGVGHLDTLPAELRALNDLEDGFSTLDLDRMGEQERLEAVEHKLAAIQALPDSVLSMGQRAALASDLEQAIAAERRNLDDSELPGSSWGGLR